MLMLDPASILMLEVSRGLLLRFQTGNAGFGVLGLFWAVPFHSWYRDTPQEHGSVNEAEKRWIEAERTPEPARNENESEPVRVPWGRLLGSRNLWTICLMYFCLSFGWFLCHLASHLSRIAGNVPD